MIWNEGEVCEEHVLEKRGKRTVGGAGRGERRVKGGLRQPIMGYGRM